MAYQEKRIRRSREVPKHCWTRLMIDIKLERCNFFLWTLIQLLYCKASSLNLWDWKKCTLPNDMWTVQFGFQQYLKLPHVLPIFHYYIKNQQLRSYYGTNFRPYCPRKPENIQSWKIQKFEKLCFCYIAPIINECQKSAFLISHIKSVII